MTLEDRLNELETAIQSIRRDMRAQRKFKVGDEVWISAVVQQVDCSDTELPYSLKVADDENLGWFAESCLHPKVP